MLNEMTNLDYHTHDGQCHANKAKYKEKSCVLQNGEDMALIKTFFTERCVECKGNPCHLVIRNIQTAKRACEQGSGNRDEYYQFDGRQASV